MTKPYSFVLSVMQKIFLLQYWSQKTTNYTIVSWIIMLQIYLVKAFLEVSHADRRPEANQLASKIYSETSWINWFKGNLYCDLTIHNPHLITCMIDWTWPHFNTLRPRQDGRHFADDIFTCISSMIIAVFWLNFHWNIFARVRLTIFEHWFR